MLNMKNKPVDNAAGNPKQGAPAEGGKKVEPASPPGTPPTSSVGPTAPAKEIAPPPRRVANTPPDGWASSWVRRGAIETRVVGARVGRPVLVDTKSGGEYRGPDSVLLVWVQTRRLSGAASTLLRWTNPLYTHATLNAGGAKIAIARLNGAALQGQIDKPPPLVAGGDAATDVLAFEVPAPTAAGLTLRLDGSHVREGDDFVHVIPADAWKK